MEAKISVIVPVYNVQPYLEKCLKSIKKQTYGNLEILCVNDGSTDSSAEILEKFAQSDLRIRVITQTNSGASAARNAALECASGEYLLFVDGDDWIDEKTCEIALEAMVKSGADVVMWSYIRELPGQSRPKNIMEQDRIYGEEDVEYYLHRRMVGIVGKELSNPENADALCTIWGKLYRRKLIEENNIRFFDIRMTGTYEDGLFNLDVFAHAKKAVFLNRHLYHYRRDNISSITTAYNSRLRDKWETLIDILEGYAHSPLYKEALSNRIVLSLIPLGINEMEHPGEMREKIKGISEILRSERYRAAIREFKMSYLPMHWKLFFSCARYKFSLGIYIMLVVIQRIRGR